MVPALTPERSASSLIFNSTRSSAPGAAASASLFMLAPTPAMAAASHPQGRVPPGLRRPRGRSGCQQLGHLFLRVAGGEQDGLGVLAERRAGQARMLAGRTRQLDRYAELADSPLDSGLVDLDHHAALAHERGVERLVELEHGLQAAVVLRGERLPVGSRA